MQRTRDMKHECCWRTEDRRFLEGEGMSTAIGSGRPLRFTATCSTSGWDAGEVFNFLATGGCPLLREEASSRGLTTGSSLGTMFVLVEVNRGSAGNKLPLTEEWVIEAGTESRFNSFCSSGGLLWIRDFTARLDLPASRFDEKVRTALSLNRSCIRYSWVGGGCAVR